MNDRAVIAEGHGDGALAAEHAFSPEPFGEPVDVPHAIQERQNCGLGADCLGEGRYRALKVKGFAAEHHQVERLGHVLLQHNRRRSAVEVADWAPN